MAVAPPPALRLEIGRIALHGLAAGSRRRFQRAFADGLRSALAALPAEDWRGGSDPVRLGTLRLGPARTPEALGRAAAAAVINALAGDRS